MVLQNWAKYLVRRFFTVGQGHQKNLLRSVSNLWLVNMNRGVITGKTDLAQIFLIFKESFG